MQHTPKPSYQDPTPRFDGGIEITYPGMPVVIRVSSGKCYVVGQDFLVHRVKFSDIVKYKQLCYDRIIQDNPVQSAISLSSAFKSAGVTEPSVFVTLFTGYKYDTAGNRIEYDNSNLMRMLICMLEDGDPVEKIKELAKTVYLGQRSDAKLHPRAHVSMEFEKEIKLTPDISTREDPFPYYFLTYYGTSRVDMDFCRNHRDDFIRDAMIKIKSTKLYGYLDLPDSAYIVERMGLAKDHSVQLVIGLKHELIDALKDVALPPSREEQKKALRMLLAEEMAKRGKPNRY